MCAGLPMIGCQRWTTRCWRWYELLAYGSAGSNSDVKTSQTNGRCELIRAVKDDHEEAALISSESMVHYSAGRKVAVRQRSHQLLIRCQQIGFESNRH
jgi:hypothetical protein